MAALPDRETYFARWAQLHGGLDPRASRLVGAWLRVSYLVARPLASAGVAPLAVTAAGLLLAAAAVPLAQVGGGWLLVATLVVVLSGLLDSLDGAVAILRDRTSAWGHVMDSVVDRVSDGLFALALWRAGARGELAAAAGAIGFLTEYTRARATVAGMSEVGVVTVAERPTRLIVTAAFLACSGALGGEWAQVGAAILIGLGLIGFIQLLVAVRTRLPSGR